MSISTESLTPSNVLKKNARNARVEVRAKERQRPVTLKRKIGYHDEKEEDEEDIPDAARMKVDDGQEGHS